jgi:protease-4
MGVLSSIGRGLDFLRKTLHLILLLVIFGFLFGLIARESPALLAKGALVIQPEGQIVEQLSGDPVERALNEAQGNSIGETLLWDLTDSLRAAKTDDRVQAVLLQLDYMSGGGQPTLEEFTRAIDDFRASGKKVIAAGSSFEQAGYLVAAHADEIYLDPQGFVIIEGYGRFRQYYKDLLEKLGVDVNVFRVGAYKSAVETYTRMDMSAEDREESLAYLENLWSNYQTRVGAARKLPAESIAKYSVEYADRLTAAKGDGARVALDAKLITGIKTREEVEQRLIELVGADDEHETRFAAIAFDDYSRLHRAERAGKGRDDAGRIGVVVASGEILDGDQPPGAVGGETLSQLIREAREDEEIKALVLRIDSPGGSVFASEQIRRELQAFRKSGRPVVASMGDLAASGGYYIAAQSDEVIANTATITGSIGIYAAVPTINRTLGKVGVGVDGVATTPLPGQLRLDRPLGPDLSRMIQSFIEKGYADFIALVADGRKKSVADIDAVAQGRVWAGKDALQKGLVDGLGSFDDAVKAAARRAKLAEGEYELEFLEPELSLAAQLAQQFQVRLAGLFGGAATEQQKRLAKLASQLDPVTRELDRLNRMSVRSVTVAYCFCSVD